MLSRTTPLRRDNKPLSRKTPLRAIANVRDTIPLDGDRKPLRAGNAGRPGLVKQRPKRSKRTSDKTLKKRLWKQFSIHIRVSAADEQGYVQCVTCPARHLWNSGEIHAGHWIHNRLDFEERNIHPQCVRCNYHWNTQVTIAYSVFMARTYGVEVMDELRLLSHTKGNRYKRVELLELLDKYRALNAENPLVEKG